MDDALLLFVDPDEALQQSVTTAAVGTGVRVVAVENARRALNLARVITPAVVVAEFELADEDGIWLAQQVRAEPALELTPVVLMTHERDLAVRLRALRSGVDIIIEKPIAAEGVLAQVRALAAMAGRIQDRIAVSTMLRRPPMTDDEPLSSPRAPLGGDVSMMPAPTIFTILELDQMSGVLDLPFAGSERLLVELASGYVVGGSRGATDLSPGDAVRAALVVRQGRFEFRAGPKKPAPPNAQPTTRYIWAAVDEAAKSSLALLSIVGSERDAETVARPGHIDDEESFADAAEVLLRPDKPKPKAAVDVKATLVSAPTINELFPPGTRATELVRIASEAPPPPDADDVEPDDDDPAKSTSKT